ncbi:MAG: asparagine synthase (glutamine-hydrolyzing) [Oscillospiraceae bacterium]|jgi:asparagine synthase (glutamine-hydrolysing)|nr:asparagine synthase (glutamine-hydrolyzing) [Oscillospiraceae bacterium]
MCGIVGFFNERNSGIDNKKVIADMAARIRHRGPDQGDFYVDGYISLGFRRLSIIDLADGSQPILNEDGTRVLLFNGEIYNYQALRAELLERGHVFKTRTDSEVILHGYEEYGEGILQRLRGMFAFVIYDTNTQTLFGARDIFGIKPLFYYQNDAAFMFASEIKAFLAHPSFKKAVNRERIPEYLCFEYIPSEETLFENVYKIPAGSYFTVKNNALTVTPYFELKYAIDGTKPIEFWEDLIEETFGQSTVAHSISDVEVGCFLSSGVDSSYVVREMAKHNNVKTFSVGFEEEKYSELKYAEEFAAFAGVDIFTKKISADEYFDAVPTVQYHMDEPLPNPSAIALYFLCRKAAEYVKVVLSGEGADELFGGYHYYREPLDFAKYMRVPKPIRKLLSVCAKALPQGFHGKRFLTRGAEDMDTRYIRNNYVFDHTERDAILSPVIAQYATHNPAEFTKVFFDECRDEDDITKMQYVDIKTWLQQDILVKADRMSMANSLELRVPFLDKEMLKTALGIPSKYRVNTETTKVALRGAAARQLPAKTAAMPKKGFPVPLNDWLKQDKYYEIVRRAFTSDDAALFFNRESIMKLLDDHRQGRAGNMKKIWSVYSFLVWYDEYFVKTPGGCNTAGGSRPAPTPSRSVARKPKHDCYREMSS